MNWLKEIIEMMSPSHTTPREPTVNYEIMMMVGESFGLRATLHNFFFDSKNCWNPMPLIYVRMEV